MLMLGKKSKLIKPSELSKISTPKATKSWVPIPHATLRSLTLKELQQFKRKPEKEKIGISKDGNKYFGMLYIPTESSNGHQTIIGIRNSHDKILGAGLVLGSNVLVCDNLAFSGEVRISRRHTKEIESDLPKRIANAMEFIFEKEKSQNELIETFQKREIDDTDAYELMFNLLEQDIISTREILPIHKEWREPEFEEFAEPTLWTLFNCCTRHMNHGVKFIDRVQKLQEVLATVDE